MSAISRGVIAGLNQFVQVSTNDAGTVGISITTDISWSGVIGLQATVDMVNWIQASAYNIDGGEQVMAFTATNATGIAAAATAGMQAFRVIATSYGAGTANVTLYASSGTSAISLSNAAPGVLVDRFSQGFPTGANFASMTGGLFSDTIGQPAAGQPAVCRITQNRALHGNLRDASGTELATATNPARVDPTGTTNQPVSGTVTGNQGTPNTAANSWPVEVTDGTNVLGVSAHPLRTDPTGTTPQPVSGSVSVSNFPGTQPVSGTVTANQGTANTPANSWPVEITDGANVLGVSAHPVRTDPTGTTTQPISGAVNQGTANTAGNAWPIELTDGTRTGTLAALGNDNSLSIYDTQSRRLLEQIFLELRWLRGIDAEEVPGGVVHQGTPGPQPWPVCVLPQSNIQTMRANYTTAQTNTVIVSVPAGMVLVVTRLLVTASKANSVNVGVRVGLCGTVTPTGAQIVGSHPGIDPGGGFNTGDGSGIIAMGYLGDDLLITSDVPTGGSIDVVVTYYYLPFCN